PAAASPAPGPPRRRRGRAPRSPEKSLQRLGVARRERLPVVVEVRVDVDVAAPASDLARPVLELGRRVVATPAAAAAMEADEGERRGELLGLERAGGVVADDQTGAGAA